MGHRPGGRISAQLAIADIQIGPAIGEVAAIDAVVVELVGSATLLPARFRVFELVDMVCPDLLGVAQVQFRPSSVHSNDIDRSLVPAEDEVLRLERERSVDGIVAVDRRHQAGVADTEVVDFKCRARNRGRNEPQVVQLPAAPDFEGKVDAIDVERAVRGETRVRDGETARGVKAGQVARARIAIGVTTIQHAVVNLDLTGVVGWQLEAHIQVVVETEIKVRAAGDAVERNGGRGR